MYGAIIGDIAGSRFEFTLRRAEPDFKLFTEANTFTDDTVMTVAIADALMELGDQATVEDIKSACVERMQYWGKRYPDVVYGSSFLRWLNSEDPKPYGSWGNGSAMRVSSVGWLYETIEDTVAVAKATAEVTHDHPEGIRGAECTAAMIYMARNYDDKEDMKKMATEYFGYDLSASLDELRESHGHDVSCMDALPKALQSFFEGDSYEEVIRNAISLGGDTDTVAAIAGSIAEAYYGIPEGILEQAMKYLPEELIEVAVDFYDLIKDDHKYIPPEDGYEENVGITIACSVLHELTDIDTQLEMLENLVHLIVMRMLVDGRAPVPYVDKDQSILVMQALTANDGKLWIPFFTNTEEASKGEVAELIKETPIAEIVEETLERDDVEGVIINPFSNCTNLDKKLLEVIYKRYRENKE
ncbi:MAG: ADP-ribosylglycohydrolase family protein [Lachnospiraceae bacterium]|nr:ADP-ribosylglycohydrolase family protein [Candidatus Equihabitans merdae]